MASWTLWACGIMTAISAIVSFGYSIAGLRTAAPTARTGAMYACARSVALVVVALVAPVTGIVGFVAAVALAMVIVQGADAVIGGLIHDRVKTIGPAVVAVVNLGALVWLLVG